ncbi:MAG: hypothetical protein HZC18_06855 [Candidatus Omnitrophica bacterium]|nr:hypothetical protein [Candidatus Omnitrophota bacterium]
MELSILYVVSRKRKLQRMIILVETASDHRPPVGDWGRRIVFLSTENVRFVGIEK